MDEESLDPRTALSSLRRRRRVLLAAAALGAAAGLAFVVVRPPMYVSESLVLLPEAPSVGGQPTAREVETEVVIASSEAVLGPAGEDLSPKMSAVELARIVEVTSESNDVLRIKASSDTARRAQAISQAVAEAEADYIAGLGGSMTDAERASLAKRQLELQATLDTLSQQIETTRARIQRQDPNSLGARADSSALAQLTAQQANIVLQMDMVNDRAASPPRAAATVIQDASPGQRARLATAVGLTSLAGLVLALSMAAILVLVLARRDQRLMYRDDIADAVGAPVLASVRSRAPRTAAEWASLLYGSPARVPSRRREGGHSASAAAEAWSYRQALRALGLRDPAKAHGLPRAEAEPYQPMSVTVVTLAGDLRALAVGPQLAVYAASTGVSTRLLVARGHESVAALWHACSRKPEDQELRPGLVVSTRHDEPGECALTIEVVVVDRLKPELVGHPDATRIALAVSPGSATGEELARIAVAADDARRDVVGVIVADPDKLDRTTGQLLQIERAQQVRLPSRLTGAPAQTPTQVARLHRRRE